MVKASHYSIYCSGSIAKGAADQKKLCWGDAERHDVTAGLAPASLVPLNPDDPIPAGASTLAQFGRDLYQVMVASAVVVDGRERRGIGIGVEMAAAAAMGTPIIVVAPRNSNYRQDKLEYRGAIIEDYVHPHIASLADVVVETFTAAGERLAAFEPVVDRRQRVPTWLEPAISAYESEALSNDPPMLKALADLNIKARVS